MDPIPLLVGRLWETLASDDANVLNNFPTDEQKGKKWKKQGKP